MSLGLSNLYKFFICNLYKFFWKYIHKFYHFVFDRLT